MKRAVTEMAGSIANGDRQSERYKAAETKNAEDMITISPNIRTAYSLSRLFKIGEPMDLILLCARPPAVAELTSSGTRSWDIIG